jgi:hypothetical protein
MSTGHGHKIVPLLIQVGVLGENPIFPQFACRGFGRKPFSTTLGENPFPRILCQGGDVILNAVYLGVRPNVLIFGRVIFGRSAQRPYIGTFMRAGKSYSQA